MKDYILKRIVAVILPFMCMYGFYVILHGASSPGGSFAGGIIVALSFIVFSTIYGLDEGRRILPESVLVWTESFGTLWYGLLGLIGIFKGVPFLANLLAGFKPGTPGSLFSGGLIPLLTLGVGIRVASTMVTLFFTIKEE